MILNVQDDDQSSHKRSFALPTGTTSTEEDAGDKKDTQQPAWDWDTDDDDEETQQQTGTAPVGFRTLRLKQHVRNSGI